MKHTPGPWNVYWCGDHISIALIIDEVIATMPVKVNNRDQVEQADANARLIAAAPDLLAACVASLGGETSKDCYMDHHGLCQAHNLDPVGECWVKLCEQAIAKATEKTMTENESLQEELLRVCKKAGKWLEAICNTTILIEGSPDQDMLKSFLTELGAVIEKAEAEDDKSN